MITSELLHDDTLRALLTIQPDTIDIVLADPPYSSGGLMRGDRTASTTSKYVQNATRMWRPDFSGDNRDQRAYLYWSTLWMGECLRVVKSGGLLLCFCDWRQLPTTTDAMQCGGWVWRGIVVWDKTEGARPQKGRFRQQTEFIVWGSKGPMPIVGPPLPGVFRVSVRREEKARHIAAKPLPLLRQLLKIAPPGATVLDPFAGSGASGVIARQLGVNWIGIEKNDVIYYQAQEYLNDER